MKILHLDSSIQGDASASRSLSAAVVERLRAADPSAEIVYRDLAAAPLAHFTLDVPARAETTAIQEEFLSADTIVIGAAFYNFTIASQLKAWIDRIVVAGKTFRYGENGPEGLVHGKRAIVAVARGGVYSGDSPFAPFEHGESLLRGLLGFIGITDVDVIVAEGLAYGDDARAASIAAALDRARSIEPRALAA